jgi:hypothetical protein
VVTGWTALSKRSGLIVFNVAGAALEQSESAALSTLVRRVALFDASDGLGQPETGVTALSTRSGLDVLSAPGAMQGQSVVNELLAIGLIVLASSWLLVVLLGCWAALRWLATGLIALQRPWLFVVCSGTVAALRRMATGLVALSKPGRLVVFSGPVAALGR